MNQLLTMTIFRLQEQQVTTKQQIREKDQDHIRQEMVLRLHKKGLPEEKIQIVPNLQAKQHLLHNQAQQTPKKQNLVHLELFLSQEWLITTKINLH